MTVKRYYTPLSADIVLHLYWRRIVSPNRF